MKFSIRFADKIVGTLVILALAILIFVIFMLGSNQRWFARDLQFYTLLSSASGVSQNMPITYKGFTIGNVKRIVLTGDEQVKVFFTIFEEYSEKIKRGSLVEVQSSPIPMLGSGFIFHFSNGVDPVPILEGEDIPYIPEMSSADAKEYLAEGFIKKAEGGLDINNIINQVTGILESVNISLSGTEKSMDYPLGLILYDLSQVTSSLAPIMLDIEAIADQAAAPTGTIMAILDGEGEFHSNLENAIGSLAGIIENLNRISFFIPEMLPQIAVLINELNTIMLSAQDVLIAVANNPLLKGGVPDRVETGPGGASPRNLDF